MTTVAVTGAAGYLGSVVCEALEHRSDVTRVVGIDVNEPEVSTRNLEFYRLDVRSDAVRDVLRGCDELVHLAFILAPQRDEAEMRDVNVGGTRSVLRAAADAGVTRIVHASSAMVYGAHADNDFPLTEESPIRPVADYSYSAHKAECEGVVEAFRREHPDVRVALLRPAIVLGPRVSGLVARVMLESPVGISVTGYDPPLQFVHESDVARAVMHVLANDLEGPYNLGPGEHIDASAYGRVLAEGRIARVRFELTPEQANRRLQRMWDLGIGELPPSYLPFAMHPWVVSSAKLRETGFEFRYGSREALRDAVEAHRGWVSVGKVRFRPRRILAGLAGVVLIAGASAARRMGRSSNTA